MARLTGAQRPPAAPKPGSERTESRLGDRGQLLLVSGFALAVLLLALAVALNAATYTESYATRSDGVDDGAVATVQHGVERGVAGLIRATNAQQPAVNDYTERQQFLASNLANWTALADRQAAADVTAVNATVVDTTKGTRIWQNNGSRSFTKPDGNETWTLAKDVNTTRGFRMNVSRDSLANDSCPDGCFTVVATDGSSEWRMNVSGNATTITITVDGPTTTGSCSVRANDTVVELSAGRLAGDPCPALDFAEGIDGSYDVVYENGDAAAGTYAFVVDGPVDRGKFDSDPPGPHAHTVVWSAEVELTYRTPTLEYSRTVWVAPGEGDA